tara:strand:- start:345 stop:452 length:108 start_codon:yes stop_codon:yes gene_type:complete
VYKRIRSAHALIVKNSLDPCPKLENIIKKDKKEIK